MRAFQAVLERGPDQVRRQERRRQLIIALEQIAVESAEIAPELDLAEHVLRLLHFVAQPDVAILDARRPLDVEHAVDALQHHRDPLEPVGQLRGDGRQLQPTGLLEVRELRDLEAVEHHLPADAPSAKRGRFPVVFLEADVVLARVDAARLEALEIHLLHFVGRRLEHYLKLMMLERSIRVLTKAGVRRPTRRLDVRDVPVRGAEHPQERLRMHRAGADLDVERLLQRTAARGPELGQLEDQALERHSLDRAETRRRNGHITLGASSP